MLWTERAIRAAACRTRSTAQPICETSFEEDGTVMAGPAGARKRTCRQMSDVAKTETSAATMRRPVAGSSNGRTPDSGSGSQGSSPCPAASDKRLAQALSFAVCLPRGQRIKRLGNELGPSKGKGCETATVPLLFVFFLGDGSLCALAELRGSSKRQQVASLKTRSQKPICKV